MKLVATGGPSITRDWRADETAVIQAVMAHYGCDEASRPEGRFVGYDAILFKGGTRFCFVEVKADYMSERTGNLYFEVYNNYRQEQSGLAATRADRYAHFIPHLGSILVYDPKGMLFWLDMALLQNRHDVKRIRGGDYGNSTGYIVPIGEIISRRWLIDVIEMRQESVKGG
jgi:hypothetical protein